MTQLGNQMKPLTGLVAGIAANSGGNSGASSNNNLLMDTGSNNGGPSSSSGLLATSGPLGIIIHGKDGGRWIKFSTSSYTDAARAHEALNTYAFPGRRNLGYLFAFESRRTEVMASSGAGGGQQQQMMGNTGEGGNPIAAATPPTRRRFIAMEEFTRQGIIKGGSGGGGGVAQQLSPWTVIHANMKNYGLCSTYPSVLVVPRSIVGNDDGNNLDGSGMGILRRCAAFRSENRFPVLTWGSSEHGGSIWRSSQPKVGLQGYRSAEDERYLYAIGEEAKRANLAADARAEGGVGSGSSVGRHPKEFLRMLCGRNNESDLIMEGSNSSCMLKIMDMRPKSAAMANRTQGYGYENTNYYRGSTINFYGIGNIHAVRDAYQKVNALCLNPNTSDIQWMQLVENTNWPSMTRLILSASWQTAFHVHYNRLPILLHCSHGWDRTSQVSALAQLLLDPHYRTREGFSALVEKDFLSFGHPFHTRCGHGEGKNEQGGDEGQLSPIFLQFLDCVFQLVNQFPNYFEFNARYLLLLSENIYSCRFGTLLCDSEREREVVAGIRQRTYCMWEYLDSIPDLVNPLFDNTLNNDAGVLMMPLPMLLRNVTLWTDRLCMYGAKATTPCMPQGIELDWNSTLHTAVDETADSFQRAMADMQMWKETALAALKEVDELKKKISKNERENE
jgi:myotubularin-related protein 1/2